MSETACLLMVCGVMHISLLRLALCIFHHGVGIEAVYVDPLQARTAGV